MVKRKNIKLLQLMWEAELTQKQLSDKVGLSQITINRLVNRRTMPTRATAKIVAAFFSCELEDLFDQVFSKKKMSKLSK